MPGHCVIAVHGGAWSIPEALWGVTIDGVKEAALIGYRILENGGSAVDAVEEAIIYLENNPAFDAGYGSVLTLDSQVELDALIMEGKLMNTGAVAAIKNIPNPIRVARAIMENTPHNLLVGEGANQFAASRGIHEVDPDLLVTFQAKEDLEKMKKFNNSIKEQFTNEKIPITNSHDTVGCVSLDAFGSVACGTSTGGITAKMPGRVGDSPIVGAGGLADNDVGAVSSTGHGEAIAKVTLAKTILNHMEKGSTVTDSLKSSLSYMQHRVGGYGGAISLSKDGDVGAEFSTERMAWAYVKNCILHYGLHPLEHCSEVVEL